MAALLCEICGARPARGRHAVEGAILSVCERCGKFGSEVRDVFLVKRQKRSGVVGEGEPEVVPDYAGVIRKGRERSGLTQRELAARSLERESVIAKIEQGEFLPSIPTARKLEKLLGVVLIGVSGSSGGSGGSGSSGASGTASEKKGERLGAPAGMTLGDLIKKKNKKNE